MMIDDDDGDDYDDDVVVSGHRHNDLCSRDSELRQKLMNCGKLSNQAPSVKGRLNGLCYTST